MTSEPRPFVSGLELSRWLYLDRVQPLLTEHLPRLDYAAALVGPGSEVLGFDTERSTDHDWGPRLSIMVSQTEPPGTAEHILGLVERESGDEPYGISISTVSEFLQAQLGVEHPGDLDPAAWLTVSDQQLLHVVAGAVWRDDIGELSAARRELAWYPEDVWRYRLAAGWRRIAQHGAFVGRAGEVADDLGSHLVAMSIVRDIMQLAFLLERRYAPYEKWFGSAFARLDLATTLLDPFERARYARDWHTREAALVEAVVITATVQNASGLCPPVDPTPRSYFNRPFMVVDTDRFADALHESITDPVVRSLPRHLGGLDQYVDTTDGRGCIPLHRTIRGWLRDPH